MGFWLIAWFVVSVISSYLLNRRASSRVGAPGEIQAPETPAGTPVRVAFGTVALEPTYVSFDFGTFRNDYWPETAPAEYWVKWLGLLCWGPVDFLDVIYDDKRKLSDQGTQHAFSIQKNTDFFSLGNAPTVTDTAMNAIAHGTLPSAGTPHYRYAEIYLPRIFGGTPPDGEGGIESVVKDPACVGRTVYGAPYLFWCGGDTSTTAFLDVPPLDDLKYYGGPPKDGSCVDAPTTSGPGRIAYERFAMVHFGGTDGGAVGSSPVLKKQQFVVVSRIAGIEALDGGDDANPVSVLYALLTNADWGLGINPALLDATNWSDAANVVGNGGEKFGISGVFSEQKSAQEYIDEILRTVDAVPYRDPVTGLLKVKVIRGGFTLSDLNEMIQLDESQIVEMEWTRRDITDTINEVSVAYTDRNRLFQRHIVTVQDHANIAQTGEIRSQTFEFPYIPNEIWGLKVAARELKANTLPLGRGTIRTTRKAWGVVPGDPIRVSFAKYGIDDLVVRVLSANYGAPGDEIIELEVVEDVYGLPDVPYVVTTPTTDPAATPVDKINIIATENNDGTQGEVVLTVTPNDTVTNVSFILQSGNDPAALPVSVSASPAFTYVSPAVDIDPTYGARISWTVEYTVNGVATSQSGIARFQSAAPALITGDIVTADPNNDGVFENVFDDSGNQVTV